jgi:hypothetical protein
MVQRYLALRPSQPLDGPGVPAMTPAEKRALAAVQAGLSRVIRYDDESIVNDTWTRQRYDSGGFPSLAPARRATVETAWHEAGHAVAALAAGARFTSASIRHGRDSAGRIHGISGAADRAFVVDAAGQIAQRLMNWTMLAPPRLNIRLLARALLVHPRHLPYNVVVAILDGA